MYLEPKEIIDLVRNSPKAMIIYHGLKSIFENEKEKRDQFYRYVREDQKAEFINGEMVIHSPIKYKHNQASFRLANLLGAYLSNNNLGEIGYEKLMIQLTRNDYEPDICFFLKGKSDHFKPDQMLFPASDFVVEVLSDSTEKTDRTIKYEDYEWHGVKEYWIIDAEKEIIEQYILENEKYYLHQKSGSGMIKSIVIEGFEISVQSVFDKDFNSKAINNIISSK